MSSDWIHCNSCITLPSQSVQYVFSSCGHIVCKKCVAKTGATNTCPYCKKSAQFVDINRSLKADIQMLFRNPRDLAAEYMKNLGTVLDFQGSHRTRLTRANHEQQKKAMKFIGVAQGEIKKRMEAEKKVMAENKEISCELDKARVQCQKLEALLATRELELDRLRKNTAFASPAAPSLQYQRSGDSGLGDTPLSSLSFIDAMTSTPINQSPSRSREGSSGRRRSRDRLKEMFTNQNGSVPSPIIGAPQLATPNILGIKKRSNSENNRRPSAHQLLFDSDAMEIGGGF